ncbi:MAG: AbrB/MazE/SpoVT family DNA-binding domain-containing protein [Candidatus Obscuribacterales bacterium]|nr:AbrB/MazE/SpoVT family DNA-binding domain-containing protein [Candidatus Obscuribacterales bacterium]
MQSRITKWGNSLGLRIPLALAKQLGISDGQAIELSLEKGRLVIERAKPYSLKELVSKITPENLHDEIPTGKRRGREEW